MVVQDTIERNKKRVVEGVKPTKNSNNNNNQTT